MKIAKKVLSILLAITMILGMVAVSASANGNPDTATKHVKLKLSATVGEYDLYFDEDFGEVAEVYDFIGDSDETFGEIEVQPGDVVLVKAYVNNDYQPGPFQTQITYSAALGDAVDVMTNVYGMDEEVAKDTYFTNMFLTLNESNTHISKCANLSTANRSPYSLVVDGAKAGAFASAADDNGNALYTYDAAKDCGVDAAGNGYHYTYFSITPDTAKYRRSTTLSASVAGYQPHMFQFPLYVPADAQPGDTFTVTIPEESIKRTANTAGRLSLGYCPGGDIKTYVTDMAYQYFDEDQYFDLSDATITLKVPGSEPQPTVSWDALQAAYDSANALVASEYTAASYAPVATAMANAKSALDAQALTEQTAIDALTTALTSAVAALEKKADYSALNAAIATGDALNKADYTKASWTASGVEAALAAAKAVATDLGVSQQATINAAATALTNAIAALVPISGANYAALDTAIALAESKTASDYTSASWAPVATALAAAKAVSRDLTVDDQATVDAAATALNNALAGLVEADADYTALNAALAAAAAKVQGDYTAASWSALASAVDAGQKVAKDLKAKDQATIDNAAAAINSAIDALVALGGADYTALNAAIAAADAKVEANYTAESWAAFASALAAAKAVPTDLKETQQTTIDDATSALTSAMNALVEKEADYTAVSTAIAAIPADLSNYTVESVAAVNAAVNAVVYGKKISEQAAVDAMAQAINDAVAALALKAADYTALNAAIAAAEAITDSSAYTSDSWAAFAAALADAKAVEAGLDITAQATIDSAKDALVAAQAALVKLGADYSALNAAIAAAEALNKDFYTADSYAAVETALTAAKAVPSDLDVDGQGTIDAAATALNDAIAALVLLPADYTALAAAITANTAKYNKSADYTAESFAAFKAAYDAAVAANEAQDITIDKQADVDALKTALVDAAAALAYAPYDYTAIDNAIAAFEALDKDLYTPASVAAVETAIAAVPQGLTKAPADVAKGGKALTAINNAVKALVLAGPADYTAVDAAIAAADALDAEGYTAESMKAVTDAVAAVVTGLNANHQSEVDAMAQAINDAIAALVPVAKDADYTALNAAIAVASTKVESAYSAATWAPFAHALAAAQAVPTGLNSYDQATIDAATDALVAATDALKFKADYSAFNAAKAAAAALVEDEYTADSWEALDDALWAAKQIPADLDEDSQTLIDQATARINNAIAGLKKVDSSTTDVVNVDTEPTPIYTPANYAVKIEGRAIKFQFKDANGNTWTYDRNKVANIVSYDKDGNVVDSDSRVVAYEVWNVTATLPAGDYTVIAKYSGSGWQTDAARNYTMTVVDKILTNTGLVSADLAATSGKAGRVGVTIVTGADVTRVQVAMNGTTVTASNGVDNGDGTKTFTLNACTVKGENTILVNIKANNQWSNGVATLTYTAE